MIDLGVRTVIRFVMAMVAGLGLAGAAVAQDAGPFVAHPGLKLTTAFVSSFGPDAESTILFNKVDAESMRVHYTSSRGVVADRTILMQDHAASETLMLGFADKMPELIQGTTSVGVSQQTLETLRATGKAPLSVIYDTTLTPLAGELTVVARDVPFDVLIENKPFKAKTLQVQGNFGSGNRTGTGTFYIVDSKINPVVAQYDIKFSWEKSPRSERIVQVTAGASEQAAMEQSLATMRAYDTYGIHFAFDSARIQDQSARVLADIATTLKNNPGWTLLVVGHTDSTGSHEYNMKLSRERADSVKNWLVTKEGIDAARLTTEGKGETEPKATNDTLAGRKQNRRVELKRTDN